MHLKEARDKKKDKNYMLKPLVLDGVVFNEQYVEGLKQPLLEIRDCLIVQDKLPYALSMSEIHAILDYYQKQLEQ